ncbi:MAG TPA: HD domain-containing phosphohydrolase [Marinagarivorans sp.]
MTEPHRQTIRLEQLSVGMFVVELDISWVDSPFLTHSRKIRSLKDIDALRLSGVKKLVIDLERGRAPKMAQGLNASVVPSEPSGQMLGAEMTQSAGCESSPAQTPHADAQAVQSSARAEPPRATVAAEMSAAQRVSGEIKSVARQLYEALDAQQPIDTEALAPLVDGTLASLTRNNQALMSLVHMSRKSQKLIDHAYSTFCIALNIGLAMHKSPEDLQALGVAALLHEVGWQQLPLSLMGKRTRYASHEVTLVHKHVDIGLAMLSSAGLPALVMRIISEHHERADGSGYPKGLKADGLHALSAILAVADYYDERVHQLIDRPGLLPRLALQAMYKETQAGAFDADVMTTFISTLGVYPVTSAVLLQSGEKGVVIDVDQSAHCCRVKIVYGKDGKALTEPVVIVIPDQAAPARAIKSLLDPSDSRVDPYGLLVFIG